jgi:hypothetical protein
MEKKKQKVEMIPNHVMIIKNNNKISEINSFDVFEIYYLNYIKILYKEIN